ncbi:hypothetical protein ADIARSV_3823 [Arcticibacter svalbardensis MN12-7]|uniref:Outer membrane protein beta-barrel domain-containing protein n=1 Tax=Arcticibacter svalbardensis MN12-7 TaxID=1150600 RepID=R9GMR6_9SPHI|nr:outer membrane beta-barrel protein [Arcticibacter svalbardensis]EOR93023.1 hypothetical protein ADIARSV_3823 [Arcticibacter svalbardensis MN12-7]
MKLKLLIPLLFFSFYGYSQDSTKVTYGLKFGVNSNSTSLSSSLDGSSSTKMKSFLAYNFSLVLDVPLSKVLSIQPAVSYIQKGQKKDLSGVTNDNRTKVNYLEMPINLVYRYRNFFVGAGPYASLAMKGTIKSDSQEDDISFGNRYVSGGSSKNDDWKKYDFGASMLLGYKWKIFTFNVNYDLGLYDIDPSPVYKSKTRVASAALGVMF